MPAMPSRPARALLLASVVLAACGEDDKTRRLADAAVQEGDAAPPPDAATAGVVTLRVRDDGAPRAGVTVYFQNADSSLVSTAQTDAAGVASATMEPGGYVTAIEPFAFASESTLITFGGVKPGDELLLVRDGADRPGLPINVTVPYSAGALSYTVTVTCFGGTGPISSAGSGSPANGRIYLYGQCVAGGVTDLLIEARDGNNAVLGYLLKPGVTLAADASYDFSGDTYESPTDTSVAVTGGGTAETLDLELIQATTRGAIRRVYSWFSLSGGAGTAQLRRPLLPASVGVIALRAPGQISSRALYEWGPDAAARTVDLTGGMLAAYSTAPTYLPATRAIEWTQEATGQTPDFVGALLQVLRVNPTTETSMSWGWQIVGPYAGTSLVLPQLPDEVADLRPAAGDEVTVAQLLTGKVPGGYDAVRARLFEIQPLDAASVAAGPSGRAAIQSLISFLDRRAPAARPFGLAGLAAPR